MNIPVVSLTRYLLDHEGVNPELGAEFCHLMVQLAFAAKIMAREITLAPLVAESGLAGERNASGDVQKALDVSRTTPGSRPLLVRVSWPKSSQRKWQYPRHYWG